MRHLNELTELTGVRGQDAKRLKRETTDAMKISMRHLIRAANLDRRLLADRDWQGAMSYMNKVINIYEES